jgi:hypothetical protein
MKKTTSFSLFVYGFTHVFRLKRLKHAFKRIKKRNLSVSRSQSGTAIVSETRSLFLDFAYFSVRLNAFLKNFVCLGSGGTRWRLNLLNLLHLQHDFIRRALGIFIKTLPPCFRHPHREFVHRAWTDTLESEGEEVSLATIIAISRQLRRSHLMPLTY